MYIKQDSGDSIELDKKKLTEKKDESVVTVMALERAIRNVEGSDGIYGYRGIVCT